MFNHRQNFSIAVFPGFALFAFFLIFGEWKIGAIAAAGAFTISVLFNYGVDIVFYRRYAQR